MFQTKTKSKTITAVQVGLAIFSVGTVGVFVYAGINSIFPNAANNKNINLAAAKKDNTVSHVEPCEGNFDCDQDQNVDGSDLAIFKKDFMRGPGNIPCTNDKPCNGDLDCNGKVDLADEVIIKKDFGRSNMKNPCPKCDKFKLCKYVGIGDTGNTGVGDTANNGGGSGDNGNGQTNNPHCRADYNLDQMVDASDKAVFDQDALRDTKKNSCTNANPCKADLNCNGKINNEDSNIFDGALKEGSLKKSCPMLNVYKDCEYKK